MGSQGSGDPLAALATSSREIQTKLDSLHQEVTRGQASSLLDIKTETAATRSAVADVRGDLGRLDTRQQADTDRVLDQIRNQAESRFWKIVYVALPVLLTAGLGAFISYKQDATSKKLATRLALTEAFYKRKLAVYEDADKQMAAVVGCLE